MYLQDKLPCRLRANAEKLNGRLATIGLSSWLALEGLLLALSQL